MVDDVALNRKSYVYTAYDRYGKGTNRLCTVLYFMFLAAMEDDEACFARKAVLIGDNFAENKNFYLLVFMSHLVQLGWKDEFQLLYGPVGHTHNGWFWIDLLQGLVTCTHTT